MTRRQQLHPCLCRSDIAKQRLCTWHRNGNCTRGEAERELGEQLHEDMQSGRLEHGWRKPKFEE